MTKKELVKLIREVVKREIKVAVKNEINESLNILQQKNTKAVKTKVPKNYTNNISLNEALNQTRTSEEFEAYPEVSVNQLRSKFAGMQGGPLMHAIAAKAICFKEAMSDEFKTYQQQVVKNAQAMAEVLISRGYDVVSGGTENHLFLLSLIKQDVTGKDADAWLGAAHITVNKNAVPNDPRSPFVTSGIRIGTPAVTTRGFGESEVRELAGWIADIIDSKGDEKVIAEVKAKVEAVCAKFPVYAN